MKTFYPLFLLGGLLIFGATACKKEVVAGVSIVPVIELVNLNTTVVQEFVDSLVFTISYADGDGDLGVDDADSTVIELIDNRDPDNLVFGYHLSPRSPSGTELAVQGELQVVLKNIIRLNSSNNEETTTFSIRIKDRAQHWSNTVVTEDISIVP